MNKIIAIVSALREELDYLLDRENLDWSPLITMVDGMHIRECFINGYKIVVANASGKMGLTECAIMTTRTILGCKPDFIAMIGVCGGFKKRSVNIGDVIVAEKSFHYQFGAFEDGYIKRELKVCDVDNHYFTDIIEFLDQKKMSEIQTSSPRGMKKSDKVLKMLYGPMASADLVVKDESKLEEAKEAERKLIAVDMESYAFLRAANLLGAKALVIKSVSDFADSEKGKDDDLREYAKYNATEALFQFISNKFSLERDNIICEKQNIIQNANVNIESSKIILNDDSKDKSLYREVINSMTLILSGKVLLGDKRIIQQYVNIKYSYFISKYLITQDFFERIMGHNPSKFKGRRKPIENVSWYDAVEFCNKLSKRCGLQAVYKREGKDLEINYNNNGFRLPTEAEWEYSSADHKDLKNDIDEYAWYMSNSSNTTHDVGEKNHNKYGLYDMLGNVWEWCNDWYKPYDGNELTFGGPDEGENKIRKGGSFTNFINNLKPEYRERSDPNFSDNHIGFRIVKKSENNTT